MPKVTGLTQKEKAFVEEYFIDLNQTKAAIRAGYSAKTARAAGCRLAHKEAVAAAIAKEREKRSHRISLDADRVVQELARIAFASPRDILDTDGVGEAQDGGGARYSVKIKRGDSRGGEVEEREVKLGDKLRALDMLCKHLNLYEDKGQRAK